jgi:hypothetical protein
MKEMSSAEIDVVSGGIVGIIVAVAAAVLLSGCATMNGPDNSNLKKDNK